MNTTFSLKLGLVGLMAIGLAACSTPVTPATSIPSTSVVSNTQVSTTMAETPTAMAASNEDMTGTAMMSGTEMSGTSTSGTAMPSGTTMANAPLTSLKIVTDATLGTYLADGNGRALYVFTNDTTSTSTCDATCMQEWQPVIVNATPTMMTGVSSSLVGTSMMADGTTQLTLNGHPVYFHADDMTSGQISGQGMDSSWFLVSPTGGPVGN
jgi:predicted lipoprotein with Yx(FWY)xxD motif